MGLVIFFVLLLASAAFIALPLLPGRAPAQAAPGVTDAEITRAVRKLRQARSQGGLHCEACGMAYRAGDRFCVRCGTTLPLPRSPGLACPSCGAPLGEGDVFCSKCGYRLAAEETR